MFVFTDFYGPLIILSIPGCLFITKFFFSYLNARHGCRARSFSDKTLNEPGAIGAHGNGRVDILLHVKRGGGAVVVGGCGG